MIGPGPAVCRRTFLDRAIRQITPEHFAHLGLFRARVSGIQALCRMILRRQPRQDPQRFRDVQTV
jgi:recombinational DNA repair ATPase RecF